MKTLTKRALPLLLACLLLCGLMSMASAEGETPIFSTEDAQPLAFNSIAQFGADSVFSFTPDETCWVKLVIEGNYWLAVYDDTQNKIFDAIFPNPVSAPSVKALAGKTLYFLTEDDLSGRDCTITLMPGQPPVLKQDVYRIMKNLLDGNLPAYQPFEGDGYMGYSVTINDQTPSGYGISYSRGMLGFFYPATGTHVLRFTNYDGEDLGTLTIIVENWNLSGWLNTAWAELQSFLYDTDYTSTDWLRGIGIDLLFVIGAPIVVPLGMMLIFMMGPMGWLLEILPPFLPLFGLAKLPIDIIGLILSLF